MPAKKKHSPSRATFAKKALYAENGSPLASLPRRVLSYAYGRIFSDGMPALGAAI